MEDKTSAANPAEKKRTRTKGNGNGVKSATGRRFTQKDFTELSVLCVYIVQQRGRASLLDVKEALKTELNSSCNVSTLSKVLEALRSKDHLAALYQGTDGEKVYKMKKLKFNTTVELAHVQRLLPTLLEDPAGMAIKAEIEGMLQGDKTRTSKKRDYPQEWATYRVKFRLRKPWHGSQVWEGNPYLQTMYRDSEFNGTFNQSGDPTQFPLLFDRNVDGGISIHVGCVRGFLQQHLPKAGLSKWSVEHFGLESIDHMPQQIIIHKMPIQRSGQSSPGSSMGCGFGYYETLLPGEEITWVFSAPTVNFMTPERMKRFLTRALRYPGRSMSPARGTQDGSADLVELAYTLWSDEDKDLDEAEAAAKKETAEGEPTN